MQSIATTTDDFENREISAAEDHGVHPKRAYGGGAIPELKELFDRDYPNIVLDLRESRRSEVSKGLRGRWHEACELSGVPPRVDEQRKGLRERAGTIVGLRFERGSQSWR